MSDRCKECGREDGPSDPPPEGAIAEARPLSVGITTEGWTVFTR